ncbi:MAG: hypothetical protein HON90_17165, partial [Halobacteriovoraceae bacterium]|nr:hypothetical protein [Halobacteriovoraceae bacterium]
ASSVDQIVGVFDRLTSSLAIAFEGELTWALKSLDQNIYGYVDINHGVGINVNLLSFERILINGVTPTRVVQLPLIE